MPLTIAIDGPAGAGKSTVARRVAMELGFTYIDTGAMYRAVAWKSLHAGVAPTDEAALARLAQQMTLAFSPLTADGWQQVTVDGEEVTTAIRLPEVSNLTSALSALPAVRQAVVARQREMGQNAAQGVVLEGRDIGTVVFPQADVKIFLTASPEERAARRSRELQAHGLNVDYAQVLADQKERDARDTQRADSPLVVAEDAILLSTDGLPIDAVVAQILAICRERRQ